MEFRLRAEESVSGLGFQGSWFEVQGLKADGTISTVRLTRQFAKFCRQEFGGLGFGPMICYKGLILGLKG